MTPDQVWQAALGELQLQLTRSTFDTWLRDTSLLSHKDGLFVIGVENAYAKDWLEHQLSSTIKRALAGIAGTAVDVEFVVVSTEDAVGDGDVLSSPNKKVNFSVRPDQVWQAALGELQLQLTKSTFDTWLCNTSLLSHEEGLFVIGVETAYAKDWLDNRLLSTLKRTLAGITGTIVDIKFVVVSTDDAVEDEDRNPSANKAEDLSQEWGRVLARLKKILPPLAHNRLSLFELVDVNDDTWTISVPSPFDQHWLELPKVDDLNRTYKGDIETAVAAEMGCSVSVKIAEREAVSRDAFSIDWETYGIPVKLRNKSFETLDWSRPPVSKEALRRFAANWRSWFLGGYGLYLYGDTGLGKTHCAIGLMKDVYAAGLDVGFINMRQLGAALFDALRTRSQPELLLQDYYHLPLVILDDFDIEHWRTDWSRQQVEAMLCYRLDNSYPVIITSNDAPSEFQNGFSWLKSTSNSPTGRRLFESMVSIKFEGESYYDEGSPVRERAQTIARSVLEMPLSSNPIYGGR